MACLFPTMHHGKFHPCGVCPECCLRRTDAWIFRVMHELNVCSSVAWIRLSYTDDHLTFAKPSGLATVVKRDFQLFIKRFRHHFPDVDVRYFACGEYGSRTQRPHYHAFIFNCGGYADAKLEDALRACWIHEGTRLQMGEIYIDPRPVTTSCVGYTVGYMNKKRFVFKNSKCGRVREFLLSSSKLGLSYLTPAIIAWHRRSIHNSYCVLNGRRFALPRYYADKVFDRDFRLFHPLFFEDKEQFIYDQISSVTHQQMHEYELRNGSMDGFFVQLHQSRMQSIFNAQRRSLERKDV